MGGILWISVHKRRVRCIEELPFYIPLFSCAWYLPWSGPGFGSGFGFGDARCDNCKAVPAARLVVEISVATELGLPFLRCRS